MLIKFINYDFWGENVDTYEVNYEDEPDIRQIMWDGTEMELTPDNIDRCIERAEKIKNTFMDSIGVLSDSFSILFDRKLTEKTTKAFLDTHNKLVNALENKKASFEKENVEQTKINTYVTEYLTEHPTDIPYEDAEYLLDSFAKWILKK